MLLQVALNGSRKRTAHPGLPISPEELATEARASVAAGPQAIHLHVFNHDGNESLKQADVEQALLAVRVACPNVPVGVSTAAWIVPDLRQRLDLIADWRILPDYASVNMHEQGAFEMAGLLLAKGIGVEAGLWAASAARSFAVSPCAPRCVRILIECTEHDFDKAHETFTQIEAVFDEYNVRRPRLLHGEGPVTWLLLKTAVERGYDSRIGLEDVLTLPDGSLAADNAALVSAAMEVIRVASE